MDPESDFFNGCIRIRVFFAGHSSQEFNSKQMERNGSRQHRTEVKAENIPKKHSVKLFQLGR